MRTAADRGTTQGNNRAIPRRFAGCKRGSMTDVIGDTPLHGRSRVHVVHDTHTLKLYLAALLLPTAWRLTAEQRRADVTAGNRSALIPVRLNVNEPALAQTAAEEVFEASNSPRQRKRLALLITALRLNTDLADHAHELERLLGDCCAATALATPPAQTEGHSQNAAS